MSVTEVTKENIFDTLRGMLDQMLGDWEYSEQITPETFLVSDLGLESLDIVVLGETIQKHYQKTLPFAQFLAEIGQREIRDIRLDEFVEFIYQHLNSSQIT